MARYGLKHFEAFHVGTASDPERDGELTLLAVLKGPLHVVRLKESLNRALLKHPALRSRLIVQSDHNGEYQWNVMEDGQVLFRSESADPSGDTKVDPTLWSDPIDLVEDCGVRAGLLQKGPSEYLLRLEYHPAVADGPSALRYLDDVMAAYAFEHGADRQVDEAKFAERRLDFRAKTHIFLILSWVLRGFFALVGAIWRAHGRKVSSSQARERSSDVATGSTIRTFQLTQHQTETLETVGRRAGGSITDVVLRDLSLALKATRDLSTVGWDFDLLVERNQRLGGAARDPEGQLSSLSWLRLSAHGLRDRGTALRTVIGRASYLVDDPLSSGDLLRLSRVRRIALKKLASMVKVWPFPAVFMDAGVPFATSFLPRDQDGAVVARGVKVESVGLVPSYWQLGAIAVGVVYYRKALRFAVREHPQMVSSDASATLVDRLEELVYQTASEPGRETLALDALIEAHARMSQGLGSLRSLPIGKHVIPEAPRLRDPRIPGGSSAELPQVGELSMGAAPKSSSSGSNP
jgi:hypothetical protein